jgi:hypothetical protein
MAPFGSFFAALAGILAKVFPWLFPGTSATLVAQIVSLDLVNTVTLQHIGRGTANGASVSVSTNQTSPSGGGGGLVFTVVATTTVSAGVAVTFDFDATSKFRTETTGPPYALCGHSNANLLNACPGLTYGVWHTVTATPISAKTTKAVGDPFRVSFQVLVAGNAQEPAVPTKAPVLLKSPTKAPVQPPTTKAPVKPPTKAPVKPPTTAPVKPPTTAAPVKAPTHAPVAVAPPSGVPDLRINSGGDVVRRAVFCFPVFRPTPNRSKIVRRPLLLHAFRSEGSLCANIHFSLSLSLSMFVCARSGSHAQRPTNEPCWGPNKPTENGPPHRQRVAVRPVLCGRRDLFQRIQADRPHRKRRRLPKRAVRQ